MTPYEKQEAHLHNHKGDRRIVMVTETILNMRHRIVAVTKEIAVVRR